MSLFILARSIRCPFSTPSCRHSPASARAGVPAAGPDGLRAVSARRRLLSAVCRLLRHGAQSVPQAAVRIPPAVVRDRIYDRGKRAQRAGGYSFPSGHTQSAVGTLGSIARWHKNRALRIVCIVLAALTAFSRMYLGVHTPLDVSVAAVTAVVLIFVIYPIVRSAARGPEKMAVLLGVMTVVALAYVIYANFARFRRTSTRTTSLRPQELLLAAGSARLLRGLHAGAEVYPL